MEEGQDALIVDSITISGTGHIPNRRTSGYDLGSRTGEVINHVVLEDFIVFITKLNKVYAYKTTPEAEIKQLCPFELTSFYTSSSFEPFQVLDIQGTYQTFAVFTAAGDVLIARRPLLDAFSEASIAEAEPAEAMPKPTRPSYLQQQDVIYLAMGDHHIHALHANGTVSSFGNDPQSVGTFGLGDQTTAMFRGVQMNGINSDGTLAGTKRRTVFFEPIMQKQILGSRNFQETVESGFPVNSDRNMANRIMASNELRDAYGDYFEEVGRHWEDGIMAENEMGAYFAFKVSASGWHSAALVLVDEEKAERARQKHIVDPVEPPTAEPDGTSPKPNNPSRGGPASWSRYASAMRQQIMSLIRWFLGLTARDAAAADGPTGRGSGEGTVRVRYVWDDQPLPRFWETDVEHSSEHEEDSI